MRRPMIQGMMQTAFEDLDLNACPVGDFVQRIGLLSARTPSDLRFQRVYVYVCECVCV